MLDVKAAVLLSQWKLKGLSLFQNQSLYSAFHMYLLLVVPLCKKAQRKFVTGKV